ncbi:hypothetical protein [Kitasatospora sp. NPDC097643]|uniref:hypothetical protein n=1 Tax=Kitasatospora sp. NPDC097643 TaxID=3157230 RepID=UPI00332CB72D
MRLDQEWEGSRETLPAVAEREKEQRARGPVWCSCSDCGHDWQSRAKDHAVLRCPQCRHSVRVPRRRWENTQAQPRAIRPLPPPPRLPRTGRPGRDTAPAEWDYEPEPEPVQAGLSPAELLTRLAVTFFGGKVANLPGAPAPGRATNGAPTAEQQPKRRPPAPPRQQPARRPPIGQPAPTAEHGSRPAPQPTRRPTDEKRLSDSADVLRSIGLQLFVTPAPAGQCELYDGWRGVACTLAATNRVIAETPLLPRLDVRACDTHWPAIAQRTRAAGMAVQVIHR